MLALFLSCAVTACASISPNVRDYDASASPIELVDTPFHAQERYQCGPAALLTVLEQSGVDARLGTMVERVYLPGREGSLQTELIAATRAEGRIPYRIDGRVSALLAELEAGRPVLVLQNLGVRWLPRWHYAVVVGLDRDEVVLRSGTERRRTTALGTFLHTWRRSDYWGFVVLRPGELPAEANAGRYFEALAALEETGHWAEARRGWQAAIRRWPDSRIARFGQANSEFMLQNWSVAESAYRQLLDEHPDLVAARNNLALSLMHQRRYPSARREAEAALSQSEEGSALWSEIGRTLAEIEAADR